jgi:hypothetical protein
MAFHKLSACTQYTPQTQQINESNMSQNISICPYSMSSICRLTYFSCPENHTTHHSTAKISAHTAIDTVTVLTAIVTLSPKKTVKYFTGKRMGTKEDATVPPNSQPAVSFAHVANTQGCNVQEKMTPYSGRFHSFRYRSEITHYHVRCYTIQTIIDSGMRDLG